MTEKYPDVCRLILTLLSRPVPASPACFPNEASTPAPRLLDLLKSPCITSFIIDAEIVAVDKDTGAYRTFQDLSNRAKKDVQVEDIKVVVGVFAFDLMVLNDQVCTTNPVHHSQLMLRCCPDTARLPLLPTSTSPTHVHSTFRRQVRPPSRAI